MDEWNIKDLVGIGADAVLTYVLFSTINELRAMRQRTDELLSRMIDAMLQMQSDNAQAAKERHTLYAQITARNLADDMKNAP